MKRRWIEIAVVGLGLATLVTLAVARNAAMTQQKPSIYSSYDSGRNGYRALYDILDRGGVPVRRFERDLGLLDRDVGTLVISTTTPDYSYGNPFDVHPLGSDDVVVLRAFVNRGGRLVVLDTDFGGSEDAKLGLPGSHGVKGSSVADSVADVALTAGVTRVRATVESAFPLETRKATPLLANASGLIAIAYPLGKGEVVAISAPQIFSNWFLAGDDNARFAFNVLAGHGAVAFDERVHGYVEDKSFWSALPPPVHVAVWLVVATVCLGLIGANVRFAPAIPLEPPDERDSSAYLGAMASLLGRARAARSAVAVFTDDALRRARLRYGLPASADAVAIGLRADRDDVRRAVIDLEHLRSIDRPGEAQLVRAALLNARLRKDLAK
jgi:hypothetical protein